MVLEAVKSLSIGTRPVTGSRTRTCKIVCTLDKTQMGHHRKILHFKLGCKPLGDSLLINFYVGDQLQPAGLVLGPGESVGQGKACKLRTLFLEAFFSFQRITACSPFANEFIIMAGATADTARRRVVDSDGGVEYT